MATAYIIEISDEAVTLLMRAEIEDEDGEAEDDTIGDARIDVLPGKSYGGKTYAQLRANGLGEVTLE